MKLATPPARPRPLAVLLLSLLAPVATAGSADAPEVPDAEGDCAFPHGAPYLDITGVWIENEDAESFHVVVALAAFEERIAEGAGYTVQFEHQGKRWGIVAMFRPVSDEGWSFFTGKVDAEEALPETFRPAAGRFEAAEAPLIRVPFPKSIFPHDDPQDRTLRGFEAASADLRTAYPFLLAGDPLVPGSSNGKWLVCDTAASDATYVFADGMHAGPHHGAHAPADMPSSAPAEAAAFGPAGGTSPAPSGGDVREESARDVALPPLLALGVLAAVGRAWRRR